MEGLRRSYLVAPILLLLLVGAALTALLPSIEDRGNVGAMGALRRRATAGSNANAIPRHQMEEQAEQDATAFTIVIQTYNRTDVLLKLLNHYQAVPHLRRVIIVWNNIGERTPQELWDALGPHPIPVVFKEQRVNRMRNRLQPFAEIDTDAVLMLDDDTLVSVPDISFAFSVWKLDSCPVNMLPRYSMVLIGAAFFHRRYLQLFQEQPPEVHALVDDTQNCDDIAMNFAVAAELQRGSEAIKSRPSGIFVKPVDMRNLERDASSGYLGMWHRPEHLLQRSYCLNRLAQIYGAMPLRYSNMMLCQFGFPSYANHKSRG
ncbi:unnamed protein product [Coregonus sp. 'balchen']|nr:unnamed protein product [Coregonus sp. 'balchen']